MSEITFAAEQANPTLFISSKIAERAAELGIVAMHTDRPGVDEITRLATHGEAPSVRGIVVASYVETYARTAKASYYHVAPNAPLEQARHTVPLRLPDIRDAAEAAEATLLEAHSHRPTQALLTRSVYNAANRWTTGGSSIISSKNDLMIGGLFGTTLGIAIDMIDGQFIDSASLAELRTAGGLWNDFWPESTFGLDGLILVTPAIAQLRKTVDVRRPQVRQHPPIRVVYDPGRDPSSRRRLGGLFAATY